MLLKKEKEREIKKLQDLNIKKPVKNIKKNTQTKDKNNDDTYNQIKMGRIYTTLNSNSNNKKFNGIKSNKKKPSETYDLNNNNQIKTRSHLNLSKDKSYFSSQENNIDLDSNLQNLLQKKMQFDCQIKEIKEFLKK